MKRTLRYHSSARRDFVGVAEWSQKQWGAKQTRRYLDELEAQLQRIAENPMLGHDAELPRPGLRKLRAGRHFIFYVAGADEVQIVRILHERQDFDGRFG